MHRHEPDRPQPPAAHRAGLDWRSRHRRWSTLALDLPSPARISPLRLPTRPSAELVDDRLHHAAAWHTHRPLTTHARIRAGLRHARAISLGTNDLERRRLRFRTGRLRWPAASTARPTARVA